MSARELHGGGRVAGNREVSCHARCASRTVQEEEGGSWGKHGFPHGSAAEPRDAVEVTAAPNRRSPEGGAPA